MLTRTDDASNTLFSDRYQQTYHSTFGAVAESRHVYLDGTNLTTRLSAGQTTRVLEIGLGLGLNCLLSADCAATHRTQLHYTGIEHDLITDSQFQALEYQQLLGDPALADDFKQILRKAHNTTIPNANPESPDASNNLDSWQRSDASNNLDSWQRSDASLPTDASLAADPSPATYDSGKLPNPGDLPNVGKYTSLELHIGDATADSLLDKLAAGAPFHAIYLDAFSPQHNPECWTLAFFERLRGLLAANGWLATYCVNGVVQRNLRAAGFDVHKFPGPAGKREVLRACNPSNYL